MVRLVAYHSFIIREFNSPRTLISKNNNIISCRWSSSSSLSRRHKSLWYLYPLRLNKAEDTTFISKGHAFLKNRETCYLALMTLQCKTSFLNCWSVEYLIVYAHPFKEIWRVKRIAPREGLQKMIPSIKKDIVVIDKYPAEVLCIWETQHFISDGAWMGLISQNIFEQLLITNYSNAWRLRNKSACG